MNLSPDERDALKAFEANSRVVPLPPDFPIEDPLTDANLWEPLKKLAVSWKDPLVIQFDELTPPELPPIPKGTPQIAMRHGDQWSFTLEIECPCGSHDWLCELVPESDPGVYTYQAKECLLCGKPFVPAGQLTGPEQTAKMEGQ